MPTSRISEFAPLLYGVLTFSQNVIIYRAACPRLFVDCTQETALGAEERPLGVENRALGVENRALGEQNRALRAQNRALGAQNRALKSKYVNLRCILCL